MKTVRIIARLNVGGPARHVTLLDASLTARGHQTLLVYGSVGPGEASLERLVTETGIRSEQVAHLGRHISATSDLRAFLTILRTVFRERPDVVHTHTAKAGVLGRIAAFVYNATQRRRRRCVIVHTFHGHVFDGYFSPLAARLIRLTERGLARLSDRIVTISPRQRDDIVDRYRIADVEKTAVVPLGLDLDPLLALTGSSPDLRENLDIPEDAVVVGYVGRMVPVKDLVTLMDGFAHAAIAREGLYLILAGDGPERPKLAVRAQELGVADRVRFMGWTDDLPRLYQTIDIFALTSLNEGTPVAAIEAMASQRPVVATAVGGVPDVVTEATGLLVPPRDPMSFAKALMQLAGNPVRRQQMGAEGRRRAADRYSYRRLADDIERLYERELEVIRGVRL